MSLLKVKDFIEAMKPVASESYRVLKDGKYCAILIGDTRNKGRVIPLGFGVMKVFLNAGFKLKEIIIKEQHNCRATGFWKTSSIKYNFLLLAHEYLFVFVKDKETKKKKYKERFTIVDNETGETIDMNSKLLEKIFDSK